jgi:hypothetical protein
MLINTPISISFTGEILRIFDMILTYAKKNHENNDPNLLDFKNKFQIL